MNVPLPRKYTNPPIQEALCEFTVTGVKWDKKRFHEFYDRLRGRYDGLPFVSVPRQALFDATESKDIPPPTVAMLFTADATRMIRIAPRQLAILTTTPYLGWEEYEERIAEASDTFVDVFGAVRVSGIRMVYDNMFLVDGGDSEDQYLTIGSSYVKPNAATPRFFVSTSRQIDETTELDIYTSRFSFASSGKKTISLGIEIAEREVDVSFQEIAQSVGRLKKLVTAEFEGSITDKARLLFGVE
jgi:uncharacterized protein (TIGR04255 family)